MVTPEHNHDATPALFAAALPRRAALGGFGSGLVTLLLAASGHRAAAQEATPGVLPPLFTEWVAVWAEDPARATTLYADDAILEDVSSGAVFRGREEIQAHIAAEFSGFPGHAYELPIAFGGDEWAAAEWVFTGAYTGTYPGLPPGAGQAVTLRGAALFRLTDGQIRWEAHYYDAYAFLTQLGLLPSPGATEATPAP